MKTMYKVLSLEAASERALARQAWQLRGGKRKVETVGYHITLSLGKLSSKIRRVTKMRPTKAVRKILDAAPIEVLLKYGSVEPTENYRKGRADGFLIHAEGMRVLFCLQDALNIPVATAVYNIFANIPEEELKEIWQAIKNGTMPPRPTHELVYDDRFKLVEQDSKKQNKGKAVKAPDIFTTAVEEKIVKELAETITQTQEQIAAAGVALYRSAAENTAEIEELESLKKEFVDCVNKFFDVIEKVSRSQIKKAS